MPKCFILTSPTACQHMADPSMVLSLDIQVLSTKSNRRESLCKSQRDCKRLLYKNANPYVLSFTHLKGKSVSKLAVHVLFPFSYKETNCFRKSSLSDCALHFCSWEKGRAGFVSSFSFPFFLQKRKDKLLPSAIPVKNYLPVTASSGCLSLSVSLVSKKCSQVKAAALVSTRRGKIRLSCCYPLNVLRITF